MGSVSMSADQIHECARQFIELHGDRAEAEAALRMKRSEELNEKEQAENWRRIRLMIREWRPAHQS